MTDLQMLVWCCVLPLSKQVEREPVHVPQDSQGSQANPSSSAQTSCYSRLLVLEFKKKFIITQHLLLFMQKSKNNLYN
jgi:hypothetical protein